MVDSFAYSAFETASGATPSSLSLVIRSFLCATFFIWAAWIVYSQYQLVQSNASNIHDLPMNLIRVLFLCSLIVILVFS